MLTNHYDRREIEQITFSFPVDGLLTVAVVPAS